MNEHQTIDADLLELQKLTDPNRPITYGVVKPGPEDPVTGVVFIRGGDISKGSINEASLRTITQEVSRPYARTILRGGEVVMSLVGNPGEVAIVPDRLAGANLARQAGLIALRPEIHAPYVKYYLMSPLGRAELFQRTHGAVQQVINLSDLKRVKVRLPSRQVQERIVSILSAYDDLIENNRRRIALLEEAARLLFREWFVQFRFPGHEHVKIIERIPEGWEWRTIGDITAFLGRGISPSYDDEAEYLVVNQKCVRNRMLAMGPARRQKKEFKPEKALRCLDVLINSTGTGTLGRVAQCWFEPSNTTFDSHVTVARPIDAVDPYWFGYAMLELERVFEGMGDGATNQKELGRARIADTCLISPTHLLQRNFGSFASDTANQIQVLADQNDKLAQARDLLLPRLMNGEITV